MHSPRLTRSNGIAEHRQTPRFDEARNLEFPLWHPLVGVPVLCPRAPQGSLHFPKSLQGSVCRARDSPGSTTASQAAARQTMFHAPRVFRHVHRVFVSVGILCPLFSFCAVFACARSAFFTLIPSRCDTQPRRAKIKVKNFGLPTYDDI